MVIISSMTGESTINFFKNYGCENYLCWFLRRGEAVENRFSLLGRDAGALVGDLDDEAAVRAVAAGCDGVLQCGGDIERVWGAEADRAGIEPASPRYDGGILPLDDQCLFHSGTAGI